MGSERRPSTEEIGAGAPRESYSGNTPGGGGTGVVTSIASLGFDTYAALEKGKADAFGYEYDAARSRRAAEYGRVRADQTDAQLREQLNTTLASIDAVRSAAGASIDSPTAMAIDAENMRVADRERINRVGAIRAQALQDEADARFRDYAAKESLRGSQFKAIGTVIKGIASLGK